MHTTLIKEHFYVIIIKQTLLIFSYFQVIMSNKEKHESSYLPFGYFFPLPSYHVTFVKGR